MPPRTKKPANRQLGSPSYDTARFWREEASDHYDTIWSHKSVVIERFWRIEHFRNEEFMLEQNFEGRQWLNLARFNPYCITNLVKEFFANFREGSVIRRKGRERLVSWVRGVEITLTPDDFAQVFQIPRIENPEFIYPSEGNPPFAIVASEILLEGYEWGTEYRKPVSVLKDKYWALHMFSCTNLLPQNRNSDCSRIRANLIYAIGMGLTVDLASYFWNQVAYTCEHPTTLAALPFGGALTEIFRRKGARITDDLAITAGLNPFNITSYTKSRGNLPQKKRKAEDPESQGGPSQAPEESEGGEEEVTNEDLATQIGALAERISVMEQNQDADHQLLQRIHQSQQTQGHLLQSIMDYLRDSNPPPPPQYLKYGSTPENFKQRNNYNMITGHKRKWEVIPYISSDSESDNSEINCDWWPERYFLEGYSLPLPPVYPPLIQIGPNQLLDDPWWDEVDLQLLLNMEWAEITIATEWSDVPSYDSDTNTSITSELGSLSGCTDMPLLEDIPNIEMLNTTYDEGVDIPTEFDHDEVFGMTLHSLFPFHQFSNDDTR